MGAINYAQMANMLTAAQAVPGGALGAAFNGGFDGEEREFFRNVGTNKGSISDGVMPTTVRESRAAQHGETDEEKRKKEQKFYDLLIALQDRIAWIEERLAELEEQAGALDGVMVALLDGEAVVNDDGTLLDEKAEAAVREYEEKHGVEIDRNDPMAIQRVIDSVSEEKEELEAEAIEISIQIKGLEEKNSLTELSKSTAQETENRPGKFSFDAHSSSNPTPLDQGKISYASQFDGTEKPSLTDQFKIAHSGEALSKDQKTENVIPEIKIINTPGVIT